MTIDLNECSMSVSFDRTFSAASGADPFAVPLSSSDEVGCMRLSGTLSSPCAIMPSTARTSGRFLK
jgi:hypothetical protein